MTTTDYTIAPIDPYRRYRRYRYYDIPRHMIYVGATEHPHARAAYHASNAEWWLLVDHSLTKTDDYTTAYELDIMERRAYDLIIAKGGQLFNKERPYYLNRRDHRQRRRRDPFPAPVELPPLPPRPPMTAELRAARREHLAASMAIEDHWALTGEWLGAPRPAYDPMVDPLAGVHPRYLR